MGRTQHFFEYQAMLASEYADLDPQRLLCLGAMVAKDALASVNEVLASARYLPYSKFSKKGKKVDEGKRRLADCIAL